MSALYPRSMLEPETLRNIENRDLRVGTVSKQDEYGCGCVPWGGDSIYLCEYHLGYDMGVEAGKDAARNDAWESSP